MPSVGIPGSRIGNSNSPVTGGDITGIYSGVDITDIQSDNDPDAPIFFRYNSELQRPADNYFMVIDKITGVNSIVKKRKMIIMFEGKAIEIKDPEDEDKIGKSRLMGQINDPVTELLLQRFWSRVNPSNFNATQQANQSTIPGGLDGFDSMNSGNIQH